MSKFVISNSNIWIFPTVFFLEIFFNLYFFGALYLEKSVAWEEFVRKKERIDDNKSRSKKKDSERNTLVKVSSSVHSKFILVFLSQANDDITVL